METIANFAINSTNFEAKKSATLFEDLFLYLDKTPKSGK